MSHKIARGCIVLGGLLLIASVILVLVNLRQDHQGKKSSEQILSALRQEIVVQPSDPQTIPVPQPPSADLFAEYETEEQPAVTEPTVLYEGREYIGILSIPALNLELPVLAEHSAENLKLAPCRYSGTAAQGDLILAAHNYRSHFGNLSSLSSDDQILFTDAAGEQYAYSVLQSETIDGYDINGMQAGAADGWNLTLFTCTLGGKSRVTIRAANE